MHAIPFDMRISQGEAQLRVSGSIRQLTNMMVGILCLLLLLLIASIESETISVGELKNVVKLERELLHNLRIYAQELENRLRLING